MYLDAYRWANVVADHVLSGKSGDLVNGATHYHANYIDNPRWADRSKVTTSIDQHIFYRFGSYRL